ncbi:MAG TPA: 2-dehydro-3-deoxygalactonokinase [Steroidobacteraceae bacterium]|nr:2-dehydro-3-deoxygalactonokinase [Steroidobacteraceae bacterium]
MSAAGDNRAFIAGDWGTSNSRFMLCDAQGRSLDLRKGPGAAESRGRFAEVFDDTTRDWHREGPLPAMLCGMVGSAIGWLEMPYLPCPADLGELADGPGSPRDGVYLVPGMRCTNPLGAPDVMRGEETQLLGALSLVPALASGRQLVCLPGTHTKWASLHDGVLQEFITAPTGELFGVLCEHSVLVREKSTPVEHRESEFERGLAEAGKHPGLLLHQIFQARSLRLDKQLTAEGAASWVSGLLVGADVYGALGLFGAHDAAAPVHVIGAPRLVESYSLALSKRGRKAVAIDGEQASLAGLTQIFREVQREGS